MDNKPSKLLYSDIVKKNRCNRCDKITKVNHQKLCQDCVSDLQMEELEERERYLENYDPHPDKFISMKRHDFRKYPPPDIAESGAKAPLQPTSIDVVAYQPALI